MTDQNGDDSKPDGDTWAIEVVIEETLKEVARIANMIADDSKTIDDSGRSALRSLAVTLVGKMMPIITEMVTHIILSAEEGDTIQ